MYTIGKNKEKKASIVLTAVRAVCGDSQEVAYFVGVEDNPNIPGAPTIKDRISKDGWQILSADDEWIERWQITIELPKDVYFSDCEITTPGGLVIATVAIFKDTRYKGCGLHMMYPATLPIRCEFIDCNGVLRPDVAGAIEKIAQNGICLYTDNSSDKMIARVISKKLVAKYPPSYK